MYEDDLANYIMQGPREGSMLDHQRVLVERLQRLSETIALGRESLSIDEQMEIIARMRSLCREGAQIYLRMDASLDPTAPFDG